MNFEAGTEVTSELLSERYYNYVLRNSPEKEGSVYLTAKIENAKDAIAAHFGLSLIEQEPVAKQATEGQGVESNKNPSKEQKEFSDAEKQEPKN